MAAKISIWVIALLCGIAFSVSITCPTFSCDTLSQNYWYEHSGTNPVTYIKLTQCNSDDEVCPLGENQYAWINAPLQQYTSGTTANSQIYQKITSATCIVKENFFQSNLNNGRKCVANNDCDSSTCNESTCEDKNQGEPCFQHSDCNSQLSCRRSYIWPFETTCQSWASSGSNCDNDYDCSPMNFWWYASAADVASSTKTCLTKYSASAGVTFGWSALYSDNLKDAIHNGQYWSNGWAFMSATNTATWFAIDKVTDQSGTELDDPYMWDPTDTDNKCRYYADASNFIETECEWGLDGNGYCPKPSQSNTDLYTTAIVLVYQSSECHTLDKNNLSAQTECGIGNGAIWEEAVKYKFIFDNHPFIQGEIPNAWLEATLPLSLTNIDGSLASNSPYMYIGVLLAVIYFQML